MKHCITLILCVIGILDICAQQSADVSAQEGVNDDKVQFVFDIENFNFFDNREVSSPYQISQTFFGSRLGADVGLKFGDNVVMVGAQVIKDFGASGLFKSDLTFYYHYDNGRFSGLFGSFPRKMLHRELPDIFIYDSLQYYSPSIHGALIKYECNYGYAEAYCNWINKQGVGQREIFEIVSDGRFGYKGFYGGWNIQLLHFSVPQPSEGYTVYDKVMLNPHIGYECEKLGWFDDFSIEAGLMLSLNRDRRNMVWKTPIGFLGDVRLRKWRVELRNSLYVGGKQFSDYELYGSQLHRGDPYYRSSLYDRTDVCLYLLDNKYVQCYVNASFHYTERVLDYSQQVTLRLSPDLLLFKKLFKLNK